jgi:hypothetical protein
MKDTMLIRKTFRIGQQVELLNTVMIRKRLEKKIGAEVCDLLQLVRDLQSHVATLEETANAQA